MRPTDFCHLNDLRAPVPRAFPVRSATFIAWTPHGVLGSVRLSRGTECFHDTRERFGGSQLATLLPCLEPGAPCLVRSDKSVGVVVPRCLLPIEPLTPLSRLSLPQDRSECLRISFRLEPFRAIAFPREGAAKTAVTTAP
jgi:hypothetical protein